jgi:serine/threonine-protein kinase
MRSEAERLSPRTIGRYALYGEIAVGGMATVHLGRLIGSAGFARSVAIKRLHAHYARDPEFIAMFLDEARLAARIVHPNVVPTLDVVQVDNELFLVMEYVRGASLSRLMRAARARGERIPAPIVSSIVCGTLHGLHAAHEAKNEQGVPLDIVHRDVSPQNILVGTDGAARVLDFGVAKAVGRSQTTRDGQLKGKLAYMAPEQMRGAKVTRRTDVYAASVVLWEALTCTRLFQSENEAHLIQRVLAGQAPPPSSIAPELPPGLDVIVLRGVELDASQRFETARDMAIALAACVPVAPPEQVGEWVEAYAAPELSERATAIAEMERDSAVSHSRALTPVAALVEAPTRLAEARSGVSSVAVSHATDAAEAAEAGESGRRRIPVWSLAIGAMVFLAGGFAAVRAVTRTPDKDSAASGQPTPAESSAPAAEAASAPASAQSVAPREEQVDSIPPRDPTQPGPASQGSKPSTKPKVDAPLARPPVPKKPDCNPPYVTDEHGHVHFKPNCV